MLPSSRVLAVDPGIDRVGIAVLEKSEGKEVLLFSECFKTSSKDKQGQRLLDIGLRVAEVIAEWRPESLAIETLFFNQNVTSAIKVAEARGVIIYEAKRGKLLVFEYSPQAVKIAVTGHGRADKKQVAVMVSRLLNLPLNKGRKLDDELDAIALGITHLATRKGI